MAPPSRIANPFLNGLGASVGGKADVMPLRPGTFRVFLFIAAGPRQFDVRAPDAEQAATKAWDLLKAERARET